MNAASRPWSGRSRTGARNASPKPIQTAPITVAEIEAVAAWRASEMPFSTNASTNVVIAPPTIHADAAELGAEQREQAADVARRARAG